MEKIWLKSYGKDVPAEISFEKIALADALKRSASKYPDNRRSVVSGYKDHF